MKQLLKKMGAILLIAFSVSSCTRAFITLYNKKDPMKKKSVWVKEEREIIHIPMIHIARQEYYDKVKQFITEKRQQGYAIYYEGVVTGGETKQEQDTIMMKVRKILCINISGGYDDEKNKSTPKFYKKFVAQTKENTGIIKGDTRADTNFKDLIHLIETEEKVKIALDSCDYATPMNAKYTCANYKQYKYLLTRYYRDEYLFDFIKKSTDKKIILLYGEAHKWNLYPLLRKDGFILKEGNRSTIRIYGGDTKW